MGPAGVNRLRPGLQGPGARVGAGARAGAGAAEGGGALPALQGRLRAGLLDQEGAGGTRGVSGVQPCWGWPRCLHGGRGRGL